MAIGRGCKPHSIKAETVHLAAWEKAKEIIRDPQEVEKAIRAWSTANPVQREEEVIRKGLKDVQDNLEAIRRRLKTLQLDAGTEASLALSARELAAQEQEYLTELSKTVKVFEGWQKLEEELILFRQWCTEVRSQIDEPEYIPTNPDLRRAIVFFGIYVEVWGKDHEPDRFQVHVHPLALVDIFSY